MAETLGQSPRELDLHDPLIAYRHLNTAQLWRAASLLRILGTARYAQLGTWLVQAALSLRLPVTPLIRWSLFQHFCGGESIAACEPLVQRFAALGVASLLDYAVEAQKTTAAFNATVAEVKRSIEAASERTQAFAVFKVSGLAPLALLEKVSAASSLRELSPHEAQEWQAVNERVNTLCRCAEALGVALLIDAEESWVQGAIDFLAESMMRRYNRERPLVYTTAQLYRQDRLAYLQRLVKEAGEQGYYLGVKVVRGAYLEKERLRAKSLGVASPLHATKAATDAAYNEALNFLASQPELGLIAATHNESSTRQLAALVQQRPELQNSKRVCFMQLLGMGDFLTFNLAKQGFAVCKYIPYGPVREALPYLFRRAEENSSLAAQVEKEVALIHAELARRRRCR